MSAPASTAGDARHPLRIGISARLMHRPPRDFGFSGKVIQYLDPAMAHWLMRHGSLAFMVPTLESEGEVERSRVSVADYVREVDGLVLQGGADVSPLSYGEEALRDEWRGDRVRDLYEIDLLWECIIQRKPVLGVCRGMQLINVAFGGTLYQDIESQIPGSARHVDAASYDQHAHEVQIVEGSGLSRIYPGRRHARVNSLHHQSVKAAGQSIVIEARSRADGVVEAIRWTGAGDVFGVQWHPEFHREVGGDLLEGSALLEDFLGATRRARAAR